MKPGFVMHFRLRNLKEVRLFALSITGIAFLGTMGLCHLFFAPEIVGQILIKASIISISVAAPISYFVGLKLLDISALTQKLEYAVNHDALTGAYTRFRFQQVVAEIEDHNLVLAVADIDYFKKVNDTYGHQVGDIVLKRFVDTLRQNCREDDVVARFGGEEFILLLPGLTLDEGVSVVQRLCEDVRNKKIHVDDKELRITASFGVVDLRSGDDVSEASRKADMAVYRAKREGRDRVCVFDPEIDLQNPEDSEAA